MDYHTASRLTHLLDPIERSLEGLKAERSHLTQNSGELINKLEQVYQLLYDDICDQINHIPGGSHERD